MPSNILQRYHCLLHAFLSPEIYSVISSPFIKTAKIYFFLNLEATFHVFNDVVSKLDLGLLLISVIIRHILVC